MFYYLHALRDAYIEEGKDRIDPFQIDQDAIDKSRDAFLRVLAAADEMWLKGTIRRAGPLMFKCFYFMHDNFRIYKHYHDMMKYFEFPDQEMLRDIQICYLEVATLKEQVDFNEYEGLTEHDRKFFELVNLLRIPLMMFHEGISASAPIKEGGLLKLINEGEKRLQEMNRVNDDDIRRTLINFQRAGNVMLQSPTIKDQLEVRSPGFEYMEIHQALLLAEILDCPAFVGEFRYPIPDRFKDRIIRPNHFIEMYRYMEGVLMLEEKR